MAAVVDPMQRKYKHIIIESSDAPEIERLCLDRLGSACCLLSRGANQILRQTDTADPHHRQSCISDTSAAAARKPPNHTCFDDKGHAFDQQSPTTSTLRATKASYRRAGAAGEDMIEHRRSNIDPRQCRHHRLPRPRQSRRQI